MRPRFRPASEATKQRKAARGGMNDVEAAFAEVLRQRRERGEITFYAFQLDSLPLAKGATYKPDFSVRDSGGTTIHYEVKSSKRTRPTKRYPLGNIVPIVTEAARIRIKFAAEKHPQCRFVMVWPIGRWSWGEREYSAALEVQGG